MAFPEGLPEKKGKFQRPEVLQPKIAYDANELAAGPGARADEHMKEAKPASQPAERAARRRKIETSSRNVHGLRSKSEQLYPEAYAPVDATFWEGLSSGQQAEVMRLQAVAQEKVGYERGTPKYFMEDFDPRAVSDVDSGTRLVAIAAPRLVIGGALIGAGLTLGTGLLARAVSGAEMLVTAVVLLAVGIGTVIFGSN
jgi:hypothetical protein